MAAAVAETTPSNEEAGEEISLRTGHRLRNLMPDSMLFTTSDALLKHHARHGTRTIVIV